MTGPTSGTDFGTATGQTRVAVTNASHPLAGGLTGTPTVTGASATLSFGVPNANAARVATLTGNAARFTVFGYD